MEEVVKLWQDAPPWVLTYLSQQYPELWKALNKVSRR